MIGSPDWQEGVTAFFEKRDPRPRRCRTRKGEPPLTGIWRHLAELALTVNPAGALHSERNEAVEAGERPRARSVAWLGRRSGRLRREAASCRLAHGSGSLVVMLKVPDVEAEGRLLPRQAQTDGKRPNSPTERSSRPG